MFLVLVVLFILCRFVPCLIKNLVFSINNLIYIIMKKFVSKWQEIKYDSNGEEYFTFKGRKHLLSDFMRTNYPNGNYLHVHGVPVHASKCMSMACNIGIQINDSGDGVRAFWIEDIPEHWENGKVLSN